MRLGLFEQTNQPAGGVFTRGNWFRAEGIPISPYDDAHNKNPYPMMRIIARNGGGTSIATNDIVLPVSDEMDCRACHASEALGAPSYGTIPPLTASVHSFHAHVQDPILNTSLDTSANRESCYRCHPVDC